MNASFNHYHYQTYVHDFDVTREIDISHDVETKQKAQTGSRFKIYYAAKVSRNLGGGEERKLFRHFFSVSDKKHHFLSSFALHWFVHSVNQQAHWAMVLNTGIVKDSIPLCELCC